MAFTKLILPQNKSRAGYKSQITIALNDLDQKFSDSLLNKDLFEREQNKILRWLDKIEEINTQISEICEKEDIEINDDSRQSDMQNEQLHCSLVGYSQNFQQLHLIL